MSSPVRIEVSDRTRVVVTWDDDTVSTFTARQLRATCACAACREPEGAVRIERLLAGDAPIEIDGAELVGAYAVAFRFEPDGHGDGLFPFAMLRRLGVAGEDG